MRGQRVHINTRRLRGIAQSFILGLSIHMKTFESGAEGMEQIAVRFHDHGEFQA